MSDTLEHEKVSFKAGTVAIVGRPNAGKSTLLNKLVDFKLSAISPKAQTTRHKIAGFRTGESYQVAFLDTPGVLHRTRSELDRRLVSTAMEALGEADLVLMVAEAKPPADVERRIVKDLKEEGKPAILAVNKVDLARKPALLPIIEQYSKLHPFLEIVPISALSGDGVDLLLELIAKHLPEGAPMFPEDEVTDRPERFLVSEIIREQIFNAYAQEVPYAVAVDLETFTEASADHGGKDHISAVLYVERESQKAILIGRGGEMLKKIGAQARQNMEELTGRPVFLELWVKVYPGWQKDKAFLERIGY